MLSVTCWRNGSSTAVFGSGIRSMSDSWISWNPRIDEPSKPSPSSKTSASSSCAGMEKCCINPGRSQNRTSMISTLLSLTSFSTSLAERCSIAIPFSVCAPVAGRLLTQRTAHRVGDEARHHIGIHVGVGPAVLDVALAVDLDLPRDANRRTAVGDAVAELVPRRGLVQPGEASLDAEAVVLDVLDRLLPERFARSDDRFVRLAHRLGREV